MRGSTFAIEEEATGNGDIELVSGIESARMQSDENDCQIKNIIELILCACKAVRTILVERRGY